MVAFILYRWLNEVHFLLLLLFLLLFLLLAAVVIEAEVVFVGVE